MLTPRRRMKLRGTLVHVTADLDPDEGDSDDYNDPPELEEPEPTRYWIHQTSSSEETAGANTQRATAVIWLPADKDPSGFDRLIANDGVPWDFAGPPVAALSGRTGRISHYAVLAGFAQ